jgi:hypothetical protein
MLLRNFFYQSGCPSQYATAYANILGFIGEVMRHTLDTSSDSVPVLAFAESAAHSARYGFL